MQDHVIPRPAIGVIGPAEVMETETGGEYLRIRRSGSWESEVVWARLALGNSPMPSIGDQVLVCGESPDDLYVIASLTRARPERLVTASGVYAERIRNADGGESLRVLSSGDELLFEVDPATGVTRVGVPAGNLELIASHGDLMLKAAGSVRVESQAIELRAGHRLALSVSSGLTAAGSWLRLLPGRLLIGSERVELSARHGEAKLEHAEVLGERLSVEADQYQLKARSMNITAETIVERAGNVYRTARDLVQQQAGRLRTYVAGLTHFRSKRAYFSTEETFNIDGEKINLG